jgi:hypothetical protein
MSEQGSHKISLSALQIDFLTEKAIYGVVALMPYHFIASRPRRRATGA